MYDKVVAVPRLLCFYGEDEPLPDPVLTAAREALDYYGPELGEPFRTAGLCLYRDGRDSVAWHGDRIGRGRTEDTMVAILSLGAPRALLLRPRREGASHPEDPPSPGPARPSAGHSGRDRRRVSLGCPGSTNAAMAWAKSRSACCCTVWMPPAASHGCSARAAVSCPHCSR